MIVQRYGRTRTGAEICVFIGSNKQAWYPEFHRLEDNFDAWIVFDYLTVLFRRSKADLELFRTLAASDHFREIYRHMTTEDDAEPMPLSEKIRLAQSLILPEFKFNSP